MLELRLRIKIGTVPSRIQDLRCASPGITMENNIKYQINYTINLISMEKELKQQMFAAFVLFQGIP